MNRRSLLKQFVFISAGAILIPSCMEDRSKSAILLKNLKIDRDDETMLADLAETIIPKTDTPGAIDVAAHLYMLKMVDDCASHEDQQKFTKGMKAFNTFSKEVTRNNFSNATQTEKESILSQLEKKGDRAEELSYFYSTVKRLVIQGYTTSEYYLTKVHVYELVPGRYNGCVPVALHKKIS